MKVSDIDRSNYLKAILILIGKDRKIGGKEKELVIRLSGLLGFSKQFCEDAINELLENHYIIEDPPLFTDKRIAESFIIDGIRIAFCDGSMHLYEMNWIKSVGEKNKIPLEWRLSELEKFQNSFKVSAQMEFEIVNLMEKE
jgi:hypothetical protein